MSADHLPSSAIAITGIACRFPGIRTVAEYWKVIHDCEVTVADLADPEPAVRGYVGRRGVLADVDRFDLEVFSMSAAEARLTDPQHRVLCELALEALEDAAYDPSRTDGPVGVFAGTALSSYLMNVILPRAAEFGSDESIHLGNSRDHAATRVAYKLGLTGPAISIGTACSTSLVAAHLACQALIGGDADIALAGGVSILVPPSGYVAREGGILSPSGSCRPFDRSADGTVFSDGAGVVVLRRLADALNDRDQVYAVILGSAVNNDGSLRAGYTAPNPQGQATAIRSALDVAGCGPEQVGLIETHGTGTRLGDPIETAGLRLVYGERASSPWCRLGAVKANIGHTDQAAGVAGLIKAALCLRHRVLPGLPGFTEANPDCRLDESPFYASARTTEWPSEGPRHAAVSAFGMGGTNAHVVLREAPQPHPAPPPAHVYALRVSAADPTALSVYDAAVVGALRQGTTNLGDAERVLTEGRVCRRYRASRVVQAASGGVDDLDSAVIVEGATRDGMAVALVAGGHGQECSGMVADLCGYAPFRRRFDEVVSFFSPTTREQVAKLASQALAGDDLPVHFTQPALFAIVWATAAALADCGANFSLAIGHSLGEYAVAALAGVMALHDAAALVEARAELISSTPEGQMVAARLPRERATAVSLGPNCGIAAINGPQSVVYSGPTGEMAQVRVELARARIPHRVLSVNRAFHSPLMLPLQERFRGVVDRVQLSPPTLRTVPSAAVVGANSSFTDPEYWVQQLSSLVNFDDCLGSVMADGTLAFAEISVGAGLIAAGRQPSSGTGGTARPLGTVAGSASELTFRVAVEQLWCMGVEAQAGVSPLARRVSLPTYPFQRVAMTLSDTHSLNGTPERVGGLPDLAASSEDIAAHVRAAWSHVLGSDPAGESADFFEQNGDSLMALALVDELTRRTGLRLTLEEVFDNPTIGGLRDRLLAAATAKSSD